MVLVDKRLWFADFVPSWKDKYNCRCFKRKSIGNLSCLLTGQRQLLCDLERNEIKVVLREQGGVLAAISAQPAIIEEAKEK